MMLVRVAKGKLDQIIDAIPGFARKLSKLRDKLRTEKPDESDGEESSSDEPAGDDDSERE